MNCPKCNRGMPPYDCYGTSKEVCEVCRNEPSDGFTTDGCVPYSPPESRIARPCGDEPKT